jgi:carbonic anhydrase
MHKANNCVITCIDFRLQKAYTEFLESHNMVGESDIISVAGCSRDIVKPLENWHRDSILRQLELSVKLHDPDNIVLLDHQDCGGYAQDNTIAQGLSIEEDKKAHAEWGQKAKNLLKERFPYKDVQVYYVQLDGKVEELSL